jgi:membrane protein implicated in regulation of membrane protease activity
MAVYRSGGGSEAACDCRGDGAAYNVATVPDGGQIMENGRMSELSTWHYWIVLAGLLIAGELFIGSPLFVLLILGIAATGASAVAWLGAPIWVQLMVATAVAVAGYLAAARFKKSEPPGATLPFDIGGRVELVNPPAQGLAEVRYRGAVWKAEGDRVDMNWNGPLYVKEVRGTSLIVSAEKPN